MCDSFAEGSDQPELVEGGRAQVVDQATNIGDGGADDGLLLVKQCFGSSWIPHEQRADGSRPEVEGGQNRAETVM